MDCNESRHLIDADVDGELDLVRHLEVATHLRTCARCKQYADHARARRLMLRESLARFRAPPELSARISAALRTTAPPVQKAESHPPTSVTSWLSWQVVGVAASIAFAGVVGFGWGETRARRNLVMDTAIDAHVRSLQVNHLTDVASTDRHTVKPWFAGKLDFSPPVVDLAADGFPLAGGRLDRIDERPAAALVFHRRQHAINLFIWPTVEQDGEPRRSARNGYHILTWSKAGFSFLAISDVAADELEQFAADYRAAVP